MNISRKHHYLPIFYLKGFTNDDGVFAIYNYKENRVKKGTHSPSGHFYENDRNTITNDNEEKTDLLEQLYSKLDNRHSILLQHIQQSKGVPELTIDKKIQLQEFVSQIFWRMPANDELYESEYKSNPLFRKTMKIVDKKTNEEVINKKTKSILESEEISKAFRGVASIVSHLNAENSIDVGSWETTYSKDGLKLCSDNPIIFRNETPKDIFELDFIFPLTKNHVLVRVFNKITIQHLPAEFSLELDLAVFKQGEKYCCGSRKDYLVTVSEMAEHFELNQLKAKLFSYFS